jgi:adenosylcobinamide kinase/adenosylcobinamide-phosphate guanylyltransferase
MGMTLLLGGARSGKSALAVQLAASEREVVFIATAEAGDDEMAARIARHRAERPTGWSTREEPIAVAESLAAAPPEACVILDCLSLWVSNLLGADWADDAVAAEAERTASAGAARVGRTIVVSNEVGLGLVPESPLGRRYRDLLGHVNTAFAERADEGFFLVAGRVLRLEAWT